MAHELLVNRATGKASLRLGGATSVARARQSAPARWAPWRLTRSRVLRATAWTGSNSSRCAALSTRLCRGTGGGIRKLVSECLDKRASRRAKAWRRAAGGSCSLPTQLAQTHHSLHRAKSTTSPRYSCCRGQMDNGGSRCIAFGGLRVDDAIQEALLHVVGAEPGAVGAAVEAERWRSIYVIKSVGRRRAIWRPQALPPTWPSDNRRQTLNCAGTGTALEPGRDRDEDRRSCHIRPQRPSQLSLTISRASGRRGPRTVRPNNPLTKPSFQSEAGRSAIRRRRRFLAVADGEDCKQGCVLGL
jgi:hypothetical protein